jgi:hypothetical protein
MMNVPDLKLFHAAVLALRVKELLQPDVSQSFAVENDGARDEMVAHVTHRAKKIRIPSSTPGFTGSTIGSS